MSPRAKVENPLTETMRFRCSPTDAALTKERAVTSGKTLAAYLRDRVLGSPLEAVPAPPVPTAVIPGQITVEELTDPLPTPQELATLAAAGSISTVDAVEMIRKEEVADEIAEAQLDDPTARDAFITRRTVQLRGQGKTTPVARKAAEEEWANR